MSSTLVILSRVQFAMTSIFHFFIVPVTIGLLTFLVITETTYALTGKKHYLQMTKYFGKVYVFFYAVGIVTGIIQEFQFGMNWSNYAKFVGDVFGVPLAIEALLAFFLESTFLGLWMFTWDKVGPKLHAVFLWFIYLGSLASAVFILMANAFMQSPIGYTIENGRARLSDFHALFSNPQFQMELPHVLLACLITGGFIIAGVSAWQAKKNPQQTGFFHKAANIGLMLALVSSFATVYFGDVQGKIIVHDQPMKFSAIEAIWEDTEDPAPWALVADINVADKKNNASVEVPRAGSILAYGKPEGALKGMNSLNKEYAKKFGKGDYIPPVKTLFWSFRAMVFVGFAFFWIALFGLIMNNLRSKSLGQHRFTRLLLMITMFIPFLISTLGWVVTEIGRYPFTVYGLFTMADSVSPSLTVPRAIFSIALLFLIYTTAGITLYRLAKKTFDDESQKLNAPFPDTPKHSLDPFDKEAFEHV